MPHLHPILLIINSKSDTTCVGAAGYDKAVVLELHADVGAPCLEVLPLVCCKVGAQLEDAPHLELKKNLVNAFLPVMT